jgi:hypothetical protein
MTFYSIVLVYSRLPEVQFFCLSPADMLNIFGELRKAVEESNGVLRSV